MFYSNLKKICKENNTTVTSLSEELKLSSGNISKWKNGGIPKSETIIKIAQHFNISTDYLLGLDDVPNRKEHIAEIKGVDKRAFDMFSALSDTNKGIIIGRMEVMLNEENKSKSVEAI